MKKKLITILIAGAVCMASAGTLAQTSGDLPAGEAVPHVRIPINLFLNGYSGPWIYLSSGGALPSAEIGVPYSFNLADKVRIDGESSPDYGSVSWSAITPLPPGIQLAEGGLISGTPIAEGSHTFEIEVRYKTARDTQVYVLDVSMDVVVTLAAATLPEGEAGKAYPGFSLASLVSVTGDPTYMQEAVTWQLADGDTLPEGLSIDEFTGAISGTPTKAESSQFEVIATYKDASGQQVYMIVVGGQTFLVTGVAIGYNHGCAITTAGGVKCWGDNNQGQLGNGSTGGNSTAPVDVVGLSSGVVHITAQIEHTCALLTDGTVKCWGDNTSGQLGDGSYDDRNVPVLATGLGTNIKQVSTGGDMTCVIDQNNAAKCLGWNGWGALGDGTGDDSLVAVQVSGLSSGVASIEAGWSHVCAITTAGAAYCWGDNYQGQLGDGTNTDRLTPVPVSGLSSGVSKIAPGQDMTCAVQDGAAKCWGQNITGGLGNGTLIDSWVPVNVVGLNTGVSTISAGRYHACAIQPSNGLFCWGASGYGQVGNGDTQNISSPELIIPQSDGANSVEVIGNLSCATFADHSIKCWGQNTHGQLGDGTMISRSVPTAVAAE